MSSKLIPLDNCVLIDPDLVPDYPTYKQLAHIIVPEQYAHGPEDRPVWGTVLAVGSACNGQVNVGNHVVFGKWAGAKLEYHQKPIILVRVDEILAIDE